MKINGIELNKFNARLVGRLLESAETLIENEWGSKALIPFISNEIEHKYKKLRLDIEFKGDFSTCNLNKSKLLNEISKCEITEIGLGNNTLTGFLVGHTVKIENKFYQRVEYELNVIEEMSEVIKEFINYLSDSKIVDFNSISTTLPIDKEYVPNSSYKAKRKPTNTATNLMANGDFGDGTITGWVGIYATLAYDNGQLRATGNGTQIAVGGYIKLKTGLVKDHKYYVRFKSTADTGAKSIAVYSGSGSPIVLASNPVGTNISSGIITCTADYPNLAVYEYFESPEAANGKTLYLDDIEVIDLTETFGKGNEPTKELLDSTPYILTTGELPVSNKSLYLYQKINFVPFDFTASDSVASLYVKSSVSGSIKMQVYIDVDNGGQYLNGTLDKVTGDYQRLTVQIPKQSKQIKSIYFYVFGVNGDFTSDWTEVRDLMINPGSVGNELPYGIDNVGTGVSPAKVEVTPFQDGVVNLKINEQIITLNNMKTNQMRSISVESGIFEGNISKFDETIFAEFPKIKSGKNNIEVIPSSAKVKIIYKPRII